MGEKWAGLVRWDDGCIKGKFFFGFRSFYGIEMRLGEGAEQRRQADDGK